VKYLLGDFFNVRKELLGEKKSMCSTPFFKRKFPNVLIVALWGCGISVGVWWLRSGYGGSLRKGWLIGDVV
jgi:hypothetical protein